MAKNKIVKAKFVQKISVIDPDTGNKVDMEIYKEEGGGIFGVDASYLDLEEPVLSPFGNGIIDDDCLSN